MWRLLLFFLIIPQVSAMPTGFYSISPTNAYRMTVSKNEAKLLYPSNATNQKFKIEELPDGTNVIKTGSTIFNKCLNSDLMQTYDSSDIKWHFKLNENGTYKIINTSTGKNLSYSSITNNAPLFMDFSNKSFYIKPYIDKATVVFNDGVKIYRQSVKKNTDAIPPQPSEREGYVFLGWEDYKNITSNRVIKAKWAEKMYTVTFTDGVNALKTEKVKHGSRATSPESPSKNGYSFNGWDKDFSKITSDITITAKWLKGDVVTFINRKPEYFCDDELMIKSGEDISFTYIQGSEEHNAIKKRLENIEKAYFRYVGTPFRIKSMKSSSGVVNITYDGEHIKSLYERNIYIKEEIAKRARQIFTKGMTVENAIKALDTYLRNNYKYDSRYGSLYYMLLYNGGVCEGYASLAQALCNEAGIECKYVHGTGNGGNHVWNRIKVNGKWYYVDFTWDKNNTKYYLSEKLWDTHVVKSEIL